MKHSLILLAISLVLIASTAKAQVGIGNNQPNTKSILDLTNSSQKFVILPKAGSQPDSTIILDTEGAVIYYGGNIYLRTSNGIKVFTPWDWDGDNSHPISSPAGTPVGIGVTVPNTPADLNYQLQIPKSQYEVTTVTGTKGASILIGSRATTHMEMDNNEIMVKNSDVSRGVLKLQEETGTVEIGNTGDTASAAPLKVFGNIDVTKKIKEDGNDLLPVGSIIMWGGTTAPAGWALCDGGTYTLLNGGTITAPDLRNRFVVGVGSQYTLGATGGANSVTLGLTEMPSHFHIGTTDIAGAHTHTTSVPNGSEGYVAAYNSSAEVYKWNRTGPITSSSSGDHTHAFTTGTTGGGAAHENRPPYYALAYIIKL